MRRQIEIGRMGRQSFLISVGLLFAFLVCAIQFSLLAKRMNVTSSSSSSTSIHNSDSPEPESPPPLEQLPQRVLNGVEEKSEDSIEPATEKMDGGMNNKSNNESTSAVYMEPRSTQRTSWSDTCQQLIAHENGYWHHTFHADDNNIPQLFNDSSSSIHQKMYFPQEKMWLNGQHLPPQNKFGECTPSYQFLMYNFNLGHQCGCGVKGFKPSHSTWEFKKTKNATAAEPIPPSPTSSDNTDYFFAASPTLRLARALANADATICFAGDSIDYQIYSAFHNNLRRIDQLHKHYHPDSKERLVNVVTREFPITHSTKPGNGDDWFIHVRF